MVVSPKMSVAMFLGGDGRLAATTLIGDSNLAVCGCDLLAIGGEEPIDYSRPTYLLLVVTTLR